MRRLLILLALLLPLPDRVQAPLLIEPLTRRVVTAPITARIDYVSADPGDQVEAGALLVRFDSTQIERDREGSEWGFATWPTIAMSGIIAAAEIASVLAAVSRSKCRMNDALACLSRSMGSLPLTEPARSRRR